MTKIEWRKYLDEKFPQRSETMTVLQLGEVMGTSNASRVEKGIREVSHEYISIRDREEAIEYAVQIANVGDYILIAGKGAEEFQERMGVFKPFSDIEIAQKAVKNKYDEL